VNLFEVRATVVNRTCFSFGVLIVVEVSTIW